MNEDLGDAADLLTYSFPHAMGKLVRSNDRHERIDGDVEIHAYRAGNAAGAHPVHALHPRYRARRAGDPPDVGDRRVGHHRRDVPEHAPTGPGDHSGDAEQHLGDARAQRSREAPGGVCQRDGD